jgi:hypothetical protein
MFNPVSIYHVCDWPTRCCIHGNTGFVYVSTLAVTLTLIVFVRKRPVEKMANGYSVCFCIFFRCIFRRLIITLGEIYCGLEKF